MTHGSGTQEDPYVVEGSPALYSQDWSIGIANTTSYFVLANWPTLPNTVSHVVFDNVANAVVKNVTVVVTFFTDIGTPSLGFEIHSSSNISIIDSTIAAMAYQFECPIGLGLSIDGSSGIYIGSSTLLGSEQGLGIFSSANIVMVKSELGAGEGPGRCSSFAAFGMGGSHNVRIDNDTFHGGLEYGAEIKQSSNMVLSNNRFLDTIRTGLSVQGSNIMIYGNTFQYNGYSLRAAGSNITVYHNNFLYSDETPALGDSGVTWDNGYPDGGNYWFNYIGRDHCSGIAQDICPDSDGIGDTPYASVPDHYPLMKPYTPPLTSHVRFRPRSVSWTGNKQYLTAYIRLPQGFNASSIIFSSIRLNGNISPVQAKILTGNARETSTYTLVATFKVKELRAIAPRPGLYVVRLTCNLLLTSSFRQLNAPGVILLAGHHPDIT